MQILQRVAVLIILMTSNTIIAQYAVRSGNDDTYGIIVSDTDSAVTLNNVSIFSSKHLFSISPMLVGNITESEFSFGFGISADYEYMFTPEFGVYAGYIIMGYSYEKYVESDLISLGGVNHVSTKYEGDISISGPLLGAKYHYSLPDTENSSLAISGGFAFVTLTDDEGSFENENNETGLYFDAAYTKPVENVLISGGIGMIILPDAQEFSITAFARLSIPL